MSWYTRGFRNLSVVFQLCPSKFNQYFPAIQLSTFKSVPPLSSNRLELHHYYCYHLALPLPQKFNDIQQSICWLLALCAQSWGPLRIHCPCTSDVSCAWAQTRTHALPHKDTPVNAVPSDLHLCTFQSSTQIVPSMHFGMRKYGIPINGGQQPVTKHRKNTTFP